MQLCTEYTESERARETEKERESILVRKAFTKYYVYRNFGIHY